MLIKEIKSQVKETGRRNFMKTAAATALGLTISSGLSGEASAGLNQKALLPDGKFYTRAELLRKLGLNPNTAPDAWITITCNNNMGALKIRDVERLHKKGIIKEREFESLKIRKFDMQKK
jgi:hypothetical protein